jgi:threonine dehydrogenase-like Zn-dependent dehydrogenase
MRRQLRLVGSNWFTTAQAEELATMAGRNVLDLSSLEHVKFPLERVNEAVAALGERAAGGWANLMVVPE